jgi:hypothetical protein
MCLLRVGHISHRNSDSYWCQKGQRDYRHKTRLKDPHPMPNPANTAHRGLAVIDQTMIRNNAVGEFEAAGSLWRAFLQSSNFGQSAERPK